MNSSKSQPVEAGSCISTPASMFYKVVQVDEKCQLLVPVSVNSTVPPVAVGNGLKCDNNNMECSSRTASQILPNKEQITACPTAGNKLHESKAFKCPHTDYCQWSFTSASKLRRHMESHSSIKNFTCLLCSKQFKTVHNLAAHMKSCMTQPHRCTQPNCEAAFHTNSLLEQHLKTRHHIEKSYRCTHPGCERTFACELHLSSHARVHQNTAESLECSFAGCSRRFEQPCRLRQHERSHSGERPYVCAVPDCRWAFTTSSKLRRHARQHTAQRQWACLHDGCGKSFYRLEHLRAHVDTHNDDRPYVCDFDGCGAQFKGKRSLLGHHKRHLRQEAGHQKCSTLRREDAPLQAADAAAASDEDFESRDNSLKSTELLGAARTRFELRQLAEHRALKQKTLNRQQLSATTNTNNLKETVCVSVEDDQSTVVPPLLTSFTDDTAGLVFDVVDSLPAFSDSDTQSQLLQDDDLSPAAELFIIEENPVDNFHLDSTFSDDAFYAATTINLHDLE